MPIRYKEQQRQVQIYDYLVYVCGVEVSAYTKSVEVTRTNRSAPGSATIVFANPFDQWVLTQDNMRNNFRLTEDKYSEKPKRDIYYKKKNLSKQIKITPTETQGETTPVNDKPVNFVNSPSSSGSSLSEDFLQRYSFGPGSCIFSKMDTVRIFIRNPYEDPDTTDQWIPFFAGFVEEHPFTTNYITGESTVTLSCFDVRQSMRGMRVNLNPYNNPYYTPVSTGTLTATGNRVVQVKSNDPNFFFNDLVFSGETYGATDNVLAKKSFVDAVSMLLTGQTKWVNSNNNKATKEGSGVGSFKPGSVYRYSHPKFQTNSSTSLGIGVTDLQDWDLLCLFGDKKDYWTLQECKTVGEGSFFDGLHHPFTGKVHWLCPHEKLTINSTFSENYDKVNGVMASPDWTDRYSLIVQMCNQVDYEFTVTGNGDIVLEFPLYDFNPDSFKDHAGVYQSEMHVDSDTVSDESGEVFAGLEAVANPHGLAQGKVQGVLLPNDKGIPGVPSLVVHVFNMVLATKYGTKIRSVTLQGVDSPEGLKRLAIIDFQKGIADSNKLSLNMVFRPYLQPNRPFLYAEPNRNRIGKINTVTYSMPVLQAATMSLALGCVRLPIYKNGQTVFQHITGSDSMALSYNQIFALPDSFSSNNGTTVSVVKAGEGPKKQ